ncbi:MAG: ATP-binding protein [Euryarchaeota archaeon HGW-Euryarchaeota-1]|nr:MAG: ATP-binding protein [Euryarchaeota archaeon HGW-Euryarchaeota-1]
MANIIDYSKYKTTSAIPEASSMIETFRAIGYNTETAIADIIDNSISAGSKNIWINFEWNGENTWLSVKDDGSGMNNDELIQAMRPGSINPLSDRDIKDLGRFGLGLKTASFSQARKLSVISRRENLPSVFWTWDLDYVNKTGKWDLIKYLPEGNFEKDIIKLKSGTIVIWSDMDRVVKNFKKDDNKALDKFLEIMEKVKKHLEMVFHKFIELGKINIYFQDRKIIAWDPFLTDKPATQVFPEEPIDNRKVIIRGFVLPHKSKISDGAYKIAEGIKGWNEQQGFYIYRNERLLLAGDWLGLFRKEEHYKLARIQISMPNTIDAEWQIDIKKSVAQPPVIYKDFIKAYATKVRAQAVEVYRHRGICIKQLPGQKFVPLWIDHKRGDKWFYKINREHPLLEKIKTEAKTKPDKAIETLIRFIEETIPTKSIYIKEAEEPEGQGKPFEGVNHDEIRKLMKHIYDSLIAQGKKDAEAKSIILNLEPFNYYPEYCINLN